MQGDSRRGYGFWQVSPTGFPKTDTVRKQSITFYVFKKAVELYSTKETYKNMSSVIYPHHPSSSGKTLLLLDQSKSL